MKALKIATAAAAGVILILALVLFVVGIPSSFVASTIQDRAERETGYRVVISGATRLGMWPFSVTMHDVSARDAGNRDTTPNFQFGSVTLTIPFASVLTGNPRITGATVDQAVANVPLLRERSRQPAPVSKSARSSTDISVDHVVVTRGTIIFSSPRDRVEHRVEAVNADYKMGDDRKVRIAGNARAADSPFKFEIRATAPPPPLERQTIPVDLSVDISTMQSPISARAEVRLNGSVLMINGLTGKIGSDEFNGWASAELGGKPLLKLDLDFQRLDIGAASAQAAPSPQWSDTPINIGQLNYIDAQIRVSAADLRFGDAVFAPASIDAALSGGMLNARLANLGVYGGVANGDLSIDAAAGQPRYGLRADLTNVRALPLLRGLADFDKLDGRMQARIAVDAGGNSMRAMMSSMTGTMSASFQDGKIQGINLAKMVRQLTSMTLSGWQESSEQTTDLSQLSASFNVDRGQATNIDLTLVGPLVRITGAGTIDFSNKTLSYRVDPKLVMSMEGQGSNASPIGLGVPVKVEGPWSSPRIYPDVAGMLDNPDGAFAKLKDMGKGLFGPGGGLGDKSGGGLGDTLGRFFQGGLIRDPAPAARQPPSAPGDPPARNDTAQPPSQQSEPSSSDPLQNIMKNLFGR